MSWGTHCRIQHTASLASQTLLLLLLLLLLPRQGPRGDTRVLSVSVVACAILPQPHSGIPEGSIDSIDRGSLRARSTRMTRSIGDPRGLDRFDRSGIPYGSIDSIDRGSPRARSTRSIGDPLELDRLDRSGIL